MADNDVRCAYVYKGTEFRGAPVGQRCDTLPAEHIGQPWSHRLMIPPSPPVADSPKGADAVAMNAALIAGDFVVYWVPAFSADTRCEMALQLRQKLLDAFDAGRREGQREMRELAVEAASGWRKLVHSNEDAGDRAAAAMADAIKESIAALPGSDK